MHPSHLIPLTAVGFALLAAGCGGKSAEQTASDKVCAARDSISKQVDQLQGLTLTTATRDQVKSNLATITDDLAKINSARKDLSDQRRKDVDAANAQFADAIRGTAATIGKSVSLEQGAADVKQAFQQLGTTYKSSFAKLDCS
jgi:uncharacterized protein YgfB (UPF0149 family)